MQLKHVRQHICSRKPQTVEQTLFENLAFSITFRNDSGLCLYVIHLSERHCDSSLPDYTNAKASALATLSPTTVHPLAFTFALLIMLVVSQIKCLTPL